MNSWLPFRRSHELLIDPPAAKEPESGELIERGKMLVEENVRLLQALRNYAVHEVATMDANSLQGAFVEVADKFSDEDVREDVRENLLRWVRYFQPNLDDLVSFQRKINAGAIVAPKAVYDVVDMSEDLLEIAWKTVESA